jgi:phosphoenolpyruvate-protein phosphotransferase
MNSDKILNIYAPFAGLVVPLHQVPDAVFAQKMVGDGVALDPLDTTLRAPFDGEVVQLHHARHAVAVKSPQGVTVLMHLGINTVNLKGQGFQAHVKVGDTVRRGQELVSFDIDQIAGKVTSLITPILVIEGPEHRLLALDKTQVGSPADVLYSVELTAAPRAARADVASVDHHSTLEIELPLEQGLHARPSAVVAQKAKEFSCDVHFVTGDGRNANAKSVVSLMSLGLAHKEKFSIVTRGIDAVRAARDLAHVLKEFREPQHDAPKAASSNSVQKDHAKPKTAGIYRGQRAGSGVAVGRVFQVKRQQFVIAESGDAPALERQRLADALHKAEKELDELVVQLKTTKAASQAAIFAAHQELLRDPELVAEAFELVERGKGSAYAWNSVMTTHAARLESLNNELLAQRANDLNDLNARVLRTLLGDRAVSPTPPEGSVLIAENLTPSETAALSRSRVVGFCTLAGGTTSHVALLARSLGLPALVGVDTEVLQIADGVEVLLDADGELLKVSPTAHEKQRAQKLHAASLQARDSAMLEAHKPAKTQDGHVIEVMANIGGLKDAEQAVSLGADGVGLLRSEFLFLDRETPPSENEQWQVYQGIADVLGDRPLTIRTLDVGGDKPLAYLPLPPEENPFLGVRGLRLGLRRPEILREQLRAILRVKSQRPLRVMFPMVTFEEELDEALNILEEERAKLNAPRPEVGIMIEVPAAALMAEVFARKVDFFSIGTNDLSQYTLAMDRGHAELSRQVNAMHPSVLKLIQMTTVAAKKYGRHVGLCGGAASDVHAVETLLGLGLDELSVSVPGIPMVKARVREVSREKAQIGAQARLDGKSVNNSMILETRV